MAKQQQQVLK